MFGSDNSIEPVRAVAAVAVKADGSTATRAMVEPLIREATPDDLASAARRAVGKATPEPTPDKAAAEAKGGLFRRRQAEPVQPDKVAQQHGLYTTEKRGTRRYYSDYQQKQEVMRADPKRISTKLDDKQTVSAMLDLAQSRGWDTVRLKGTKDFQAEAWVQSQVRGIAAEGYKPSATDQQEAARRTAAVAPVQASPAKAAESTASAGAATSRYTLKTTNSVTVAASAKKGETVPIKAAAPARAASAKAAPVAVQASTATPAPKQAASTKAAPAAVQAPTAAAADGAAAGEVKVIPVQRKGVWDAVEATGKQARAADAATAKASAKASAGERSTSAATA